MVPEIPKWSPDLLQLCSRSVSGCTRGTLGPSFGIRTWFRVPSWAPRTTLGAKFGVENLFFRYPPVNFRRKTNLKPFALRCFDFQCRWCEESFVGFPVIWLTSSCFFSGSAAVGAALSNVLGRRILPGGSIVCAGPMVPAWWAVRDLRIGHLW